MRLKMIIFVLFPVFLFGQKDNKIVYKTSVNGKQVLLSLNFDVKKWEQNKLLNIENAYLNEELEMQMIFNKVEVTKTLILEKEKNEYLKKKFVDYDFDLVKIENYGDNFYKSSYNDEENSFLIYSFFIENYMIYIGFYNEMGGDKNTFSNRDNCSYIDNVIINFNLQINE